MGLKNYQNEKDFPPPKNKTVATTGESLKIKTVIMNILNKCNFEIFNQICHFLCL